MNIHPTAVVHPKAELADNVEIGPYTIISEHVKVGKGTKIASHVLIEGWTTIGERNHIFSFSSIGTPPQDIGYKDEETYLIIGNDNVIRECATIHRATTKEDRKTVIGDKNFLMAYSHVAHDCKLGSNIIMANSVALGVARIVQTSVPAGTGAGAGTVTIGGPNHFTPKAASVGCGPRMAVFNCGSINSGGAPIGKC